MSEVLPKKYKENIFERFLNKIKNKLFKQNNANVKKEDTKTITTKQKENSLDSLKVNIKIDNTKFKQKEFIETISNNLQLLDNLSIDRLEKILEFVLEENEEKRKILKRLS